MADLTQTPANVKTNSDAVTSLVQAGEAGITAGMPVYQKSSDGKYYRADANDANAYQAKGVALTGAGLDEYFVVQTSGQMNLGATTVVGEIYIVSANVGKIAPTSDIATGWYPVIVGMASDTAGNITLGIAYGTAAHS